MGNTQDWLYRVSGPIIAASAAANLQGPEKQIANGYAWLAAKHKQLDLMPVSDAKKQYEMLDANVQESLKSMYADAQYLQDDPSFISGIWSGITEPVKQTFNLIGSYGETLSNVYRSAMTATSMQEFFTKEHWDANFDGKKVFDKTLEKQVDASYSPEVSKIAKLISTGMGFGEVLSNLNTEQEFTAFEQYAAGDQRFINAIRDYDNAKISWGRSFARMVGLSPEVGKTDQSFGAKAYGFVSGAADIVGDVIFDPLTYIATPIKAIQGARLGLLSLMKAEAGSLSATQKLLGAVGVKTTFDAAFQLPRVRKAYDTIGPLVKEFTTADAGRRGVLMTEIQRIQPSMNRDTILEMSKGGVENADTALAFFKDWNKTENIMNGKIGELQGTLATHTAITDARNNLRAATRALLGLGSAEKLPAVELDNALTNLINHAQSPYAALRAKQVRNFGEKTTRVFERALNKKLIFVGGEDSLGRSLNAKSADTIYSLARTVLPRYHAKVISNAYASTTDYAASRNIVRGLYETIADSLGIPQSGTVRELFNKEINKFANATYSESQTIDKGLAKALDLPEGSVYHPGEINGEQRALAGNQISNGVILPDFAKIARLNTDRNLLNAVSRTIQSDIVSSVTDMWSALNLLPRLGIRSVFDESLMHGLVVPITVFRDLAKGYQASITGRIIGSPKNATKINLLNPGSEKTIGFIARTLRPFYANITDAERSLAATSDESAALVFGTQLNKSKISKITGISDTDVQYLADSVKYGHSAEIKNIGQGISKNMNAGITEDLPSMMATHERYNPAIAELQKDLQVKFGSQVTELTKGNGNNAYIVNFLMQLSDRVERNGFVGHLAVKYMQDPAKAVAEIAKHLKTDGAEYYSRFDRSRFVKAGMRTVEQDAMDMYLHVRKLFYSDSGVFNQKLYDKVVVNGKIDANNIKSIEDYHSFSDLLPTKLLGYSEEKTIHKNFAHYISDIFDKGFAVADRQIQTLTREPVYTAYELYYRRKLRPLQDKFVENKIAQGFTKEEADAMAAQRYSQLAHEAALNRMIGYIDNPEIRSVLSMNARNVARYYRANEDFARRALRVAKDPQALVRLRMQMEGLDHSGFIHEDENGDKYFSIPADEIMYVVYANFMDFLGQEPRQMMPLNFTGKLKMLTPSADPESWTPTFAGPFISIGVGTAALMLNNAGFSDLADNLNKSLLGKYSSDKNFIDAITPTAVRRAIEAGLTTGNAQYTSEQILSASFKAAAYYSANGMGPTSSSTLAEREQFQRDVVATARNIVALRNTLGIFSPVSPSLSETQDIPQHMLDLDVTSWRSEFRSLVQAEFAKGNAATAYDVALRKWTKLFPGKLVYTVPESQLDTVASIKKTKQTIAWIKNNKNIVDAHRQGSTFLMPQMNGYDIEAYSFLKREGYQNSKTLDQYLEDIANINAENQYFDMRDSFAKQIQSAATVDEARALSKNFDAQLQSYKDSRPYLKLALEHNSTGNQLKIDVLTDTRDMLNSNLVPASATSNLLKRMIREYDAFKSQVDSITSQADSDAAYKAQLKSEMSSKLAQIAGINPNAIAFYNTILKRLIEG